MKLKKYLFLTTINYFTGGNPLYEGTTAQYHTVSTRNLKSVTSESETPYCLDGGDGSVGSVLSVSPCLPSPDPYFNREPSQHFYYTPAGQLQFYDNSNPKSDWLCVTNHNPDGQADKIYLYLAACDIENTLQSWAYNGYAPGNGGDGLLAYGVHFVGVMEVSQDSESSDISPKDVLSSTEIYVVGAAGGVLLLIVIAAVYFFWFKAGRGKDPITFVYRNNQENPITAGRTSSVNNQQGSVGSRVQSTAELSRSVSKSTTRSSAAYDQA